MRGGVSERGEDAAGQKAQVAMVIAMAIVMVVAMAIVVSAAVKGTS